MERLVENRCRVTPAFVEQLRSGYASLIAAGHTGKVTATQAAAAAFAEDSTKTVRQVAAEVGCSVRTAHKGKVFTETDSLPQKVNTAADESESTGLSTATIYRQRRLRADHPELWAEAVGLSDSLSQKPAPAATESAVTGLSTATIYRQRRLKAYHPELWAEVEAGTKSTHAAAIAAGIVKVLTGWGLAENRTSTEDPSRPLRAFP